MDAGRGYCRLLPDAQVGEGRARQSALRPMGPAYGAGTPRRTASLSLRLPGNAPQGRVSSASAHAGPARRTAALDGFQKSPSLRRGRRGWASRAGVAERRRATLPPGSRLLGVGSTGAHLPGSRCLGNRLAPCRQDMDSVARNHLARLRRDGEPLRGRSHRRAKEGAGTPVASRPKCSVVSAVLVLQRLRSSSQNARIRRRYPAAA